MNSQRRELTPGPRESVPRVGCTVLDERPRSQGGPYPNTTGEDPNPEPRGFDMTQRWPPLPEGNPDRKDGIQLGEDDENQQNREDIERMRGHNGGGCYAGQYGDITRIRKNMRANIKLASMNTQERGATTIYNKNYKWNNVSRLMRNHRISILAVQKTHLDEAQKDKINATLKHVKVYTSCNTEHPNARGVAFALNKNLTN